MSTPVISSATPAVPASANPAGTKAAAVSPVHSKPVSAAAKGTAASAQVNLVRAALQEATETAAQTLKEANGGDRQAQRLLTKTAAARPVVNTSGQVTGTIVNTKA